MPADDGHSVTWTLSPSEIAQTRRTELTEKKKASMWTTPSRILVKVEDPESRDRKLDQTCARLRREATDCGILVTRIEHTTFEVALSADVPFGLTRELDLL